MSLKISFRALVFISVYCIYCCESISAGEKDRGVGGLLMESGSYEYSQTETPAKFNKNPLLYYATIRGDALNSIKGRFAVNQSAGDNNLQLNQAAINHASSYADVDDHQLSLLSVATESNGANGQSRSTADMNVEVEASVLRGAEGLVQINQAAGGGNVTQNRFLLQDLSGH